MQVTSQVTSLSDGEQSDNGGFAEPGIFRPGGRDYPWNQWRRLEHFLQSGQVCVIDGANGTQIQRVGGRPAETFSSGTSAIMRPDLCQEVHEDYLKAGADIIITHTYSTNKNVMKASGNAGRCEECIINAAAIARRACAVHASQHAAKLAHAAAASGAAAAKEAEAAATAVARVTTSKGSNKLAALATGTAVEAMKVAEESSLTAERAMREVHAAMSAAQAAAMAGMAASEGAALPASLRLPEQPEVVATPGWDAAGFGMTMVVGSLSTHPPEMAAGGETSSTAKWPAPEIEEANYMCRRRHRPAKWLAGTQRKLMASPEWTCCGLR